MQDCQCDTKLMTAAIMPSKTYSLCHHSTPEELYDALSRHRELLSRLATGLDPYTMTQEDLATASLHYAQQRLTPQQRQMTDEYEKNIVHAAFLRTRATMTIYLMLEKLHQASLLDIPPSPELAEFEHPTANSQGAPC